VVKPQRNPGGSQCWEPQLHQGKEPLEQVALGPHSHTDELWVNLNGVSSGYSLHNQASVVILSDNHMAIEFSDQSGKSWVGIVVEILPLILLNHLANKE
jgi:hypothetical protein